MFGIGMQELLIILVVALVVLGPAKLPGVARTIGKGMRELRRASDDLRSTIMFDDDEPSRGRYAPPPPPQHVAPAAALPTEPAEEEGPRLADVMPEIQGSRVTDPDVVARGDDAAVAATEPAGDPPATAPQKDEVLS